MAADGVAALRHDAAALAAAGIAAVDGRRRVAAVLPRLLPHGRAVHAAAVGKAATAMLRGAADALGPRLEAGIAICSAPYITESFAATPALELIESSHPLPSDRSIAAAERLLAFLAAVPHQALPLLLLSGGASSMVELPRAGVTLADIERANRWLLASGLGIGAINRVRAGLSRVKGGGLANYLEQGLTLAISDVPGDDPALIGSGPLHAPARPLPAGLPRWLGALVSPPPAHAAPAAVVHVIATANDALVAIARDAARRGYTVRHARRDLYGDVAALAERLARERAAGCCIHAGEPSVVLPRQPGQGGRCQQLALALACHAAGRVGWAALAAGSDGRDGSSGAAGAIVDGGTVGRGTAHGADAGEALARADATPLLAASGDLYMNCPTGTNVADFVILLQQDA